MFSQFYILSPRGDTIISKDFRGDCPSGTAETFFRKVKFWKGDAPPIFNVDGINFLHVKKTSLYFVGTTKFNVSPSLSIELLDRLAKVFKDYCGIITEEALRKNFVLIYELLDEMMDYGYAQVTSTEQLKMYIHNEPIMVNNPPVNNPGLKLNVSKTTPASAVNKPISLEVNRRGKKNEIFVDILERLSVVFNANGYVLNSTIDGSIQMKSFLSGNPPLKIALNEDLMIGRDEAATGPLGYGGVVLDDANFHECINLDDFESGRVLHLIPPEGEFAAMNYRCTGEFRPPFRVFPFLEEVTSYKIELVLKVRADIPTRNYGANVLITFPTPKHATSVHPEVGAGAGPKPTVTASDTSGGTMGTPTQGQTAEFDQKNRTVTWKIKKFQGGSEHTLRTKITLSQSSGASLRKELGPVRMSFEIPMYNASGLQVKYLHIAEDSKSYKPYRWVRYVSTTDNYVVRL